MKDRILTVGLLLAALSPVTAFAYVGPGAGVSVLGALWGLIVGVVVAIGVVLFWPVRIMLRKRKAAQEAAGKPGDAEGGDTATREDDKPAA